MADNHSSEGSLIRVDDRLVHIYRLTESNGNHVSNDGAIAMRSSTDDGASWSRSKIIAQGNFDYRNARSEIVGENIITFFRIYDAETLTPISLNYIVGDRLGNNWTQPKEIPFIDLDNDFYEMWIDNPKQYNNEEVLFTLHAVGFFQIWKANLNQSLELVNASSFYSIDKRSDDEFSQIDEPELLIFDNNNLLVFFRNDDNQAIYSRSLLAMTSIDGGKTFSPIIDTGLCAPGDSKSIAPHLIKHGSNLEFILIGSYRDPYFVSSNQINNSDYMGADKLCLVEGLMTEDGVLTFEKERMIERVLNGPNGPLARLYGYPVSAQIDNNSWLVIYTDAMEGKEPNKEQAHLFQFDIHKMINIETNDLISNFKLESFHFDMKSFEVLLSSDNQRLNKQNIYLGNELPASIFENINKINLIDNLNDSVRDEWLDLSFSNFKSMILKGISVPSDTPSHLYDFNEDGFMSPGDALELARIKGRLGNSSMVIPLDENSLPIVISEYKQKHSILKQIITDIDVVGDLEGQFVLQKNHICPVFKGSNILIASKEEPIKLSSLLSHEIDGGPIFDSNYIHNDLLSIDESEGLLFSQSPISPFKIGTIQLSYSYEACSDSRNFIVISAWSDIDGDLILNNTDNDIDGDGFLNSVDRLFWDSMNWMDLDNDGIGDLFDDDLDNDSINNTDDADADGDGIEDIFDWNSRHAKI